MTSMATRGSASLNVRRWAPVAVVLVLAAGCATYADRLTKVREQFSTGDLGQAQVAIDEGLKHRLGNDHDVLKLERSIVDLANARPKEAEQLLREVRDHFDHLEEKALGENALSMITDANRKAYAGEDYEKVLVRVLLALSNLMGDGGDAGAYALQVAEKQQQIIDGGTGVEGENPKKAYQRVAIGAYVHGMLREATHSNFDDVARSCEIVCSWQPDFPYGQQDLERALHGHHSAPGNGVLYVFTFVGMGPYKQEVLEVPSTVALLVADRILSAVSSQTLPPTIAPIKVPKVVATPSDVTNIGVAVDGRPVGQTATITDVGRMAVQQYEAVYPRIIAEAVVRRVVKKAIIFGGKEAMGVQKDSLTGLALDVVGVAWEATEAADTRCWGLLPDKIQVLRIELPAGEHEILLQSVSSAGYPIGHPTSQRVTMANGRNTYMLANFPYNNIVGSVLTRQQ
jgi:hypothetical protein